MEQTAAVSSESIFTVFRCYLLVITKVVGRAALLRLLATYSLPPGPEPRLCQCPVSGDQRRPHTWSPRHGRHGAAVAATVRQCFQKSGQKSVVDIVT